MRDPLIRAVIDDLRRHLAPSAMIWLLLAGRRFGKALALDTAIPTTDGWARVTDKRCRAEARRQGNRRPSGRARPVDGGFVAAAGELQGLASPRPAGVRIRYRGQNGDKLRKNDLNVPRFKLECLSPSY